MNHDNEPQANIGESGIPERRIIVPMTGGDRTNFYKIDWARVFSNISYSYDGTIPEKILRYVREDGTFDMQTACSELGDGYSNWITRYVDQQSLAPDIDAICAILDEHSGSVSFVPIFTAIPMPDVLDPVDRARVEAALLGHCEWLISRGCLPELFACFEQLFPVWFDSFEIIAERLPIGLREGHIERMPYYVAGGGPDRTYDNMTEVRAVIEREFPPDEWDELTRQALKHHQMIMFDRAFRQRWPNGLPLKSKTDLEPFRIMVRHQVSNAGQHRIEDQSS